MRPLLSTLLVAAMTALPMAAKADLVTFDVSGTINYTDTVSGTLLIDTATGTFVSADLQYLGTNFDVGGASLLADSNPAMPLGYVIGVTPSDFDANAVLLIILPQYSLVGYSGGVICHNVTNSESFVQSNCGNELVSLGNDGWEGGIWTSGFITADPDTLAPEPATFVLLGTAVFIVLSVGRRRLRNQG